MTVRIGASIDSNKKNKWLFMIFLTITITVVSVAFALDVSRSTDDYLNKVRSDWNKYCYLSKDEKKCEASQEEFKSFIPSFIQLKYLEWSCRGKPWNCYYASIFNLRNKNTTAFLKYSKVGCSLGDASSCYERAKYFLQIGGYKKYESSMEMSCILSPIYCNHIGNYYSEKGERELALKMFSKGCESNEPVSCYNAACLHSVLSEVENSYRLILRAIMLGYTDKNKYLSDPDLENLRKSEKNAEILKMFKL